MIQAGVLRRVLVAGGGITAWCAAAALKRRAPFLDVTILVTPPVPDALADRIACTLPSLPGFHRDLGIGEGDAVVRTGAGYRLGTMFVGWAEGLPDYVHAYDRYGHAFGSTSFHLHWMRAAALGEAAPFDSYAPAAALARDDRFVPPATDTPFGDHEYGLTLDIAAYATMIRAFALHVGVREERGTIAGAVVDGRGFITQVALDGGQRLDAQLFVDATGPQAQLRGAIDQDREDWSAWLPCDRVLLAPGDDAPRLLTTVEAHPAGWRWTSGVQSGFAYASASLSDGKAGRTLRNAVAKTPDTPIRIRPGTRPRPWRGNCIAVGDAATEVEPLEWCNLHLALSAIDRLVTMLPGRSPAEVEAADFNRQSLAEAYRARDFLAAHWRTARRNDPLWRSVTAAAPPASLAHTLAQWRERGRLPFYEEETFTRDSWAAMLIGQGCIPRRIDPLVDMIPPGDARAAMAAIRTRITAALSQVPTHAAYRAAQAKRLSR
ncbi:tryptophan halogenase family protein [Sphingomonas sp. XXL09]|uniref:tryptophan halogenase family protein n=1 Tax=Sphingomonas sp. XXL09 TaxID=3457787 RepID=UPI00406BC705